MRGLIFTHSPSNLLLISEIFAKFAVTDRIAEARSRATREGSVDILKSVYSTLFLDYLKPGKFQSLSRM